MSTAQARGNAARRDSPAPLYSTDNSAAVVNPLTGEPLVLSRTSAAQLISEARIVRVHGDEVRVNSPVAQMFKNMGEQFCRRLRGEEDVLHDSVTEASKAVAQVDYAAVRLQQEITTGELVLAPELVQSLSLTTPTVSSSNSSSGQGVS